MLMQRFDVELDELDECPKTFEEASNRGQGPHVKV
jgi:hypothetical protein